MRIPHHLLLSAGVVLLASCGGGGGGGGGNDPLAQPTSFLPEGVTVATLQFGSKSGLEPVQLTQKTENTKSADAPWTATVSGGRVQFPISGGMQIDAKLVGEVEVTRQTGNQGFLLTWRSPDSYAAGEAALEGSMRLQYYNMNDNSGFRQASVTSPEIKLIYSDNGTVMEKDFAPGLDGSTVQVSFSPSKPQTPPASNPSQGN